MEIIKFEKKHFKEAMECYKDGIDLGICTFNDTVPDYDLWNNSHHLFGRFVAIVDNHVVGFCSLCRFAYPSFYDGVAEVSIYVRNEYLHLGIGSALMEKLIPNSEENGIWTLVAHIMAINERSISFHEKMGFRVVGRREALGKRSDGVWLDTILMERRSRVVF